MSEVVSRMFASWKQLDGWLRQVEVLQRPAASGWRELASGPLRGRSDTISGIMSLMPWSVETLNETVDAELAELPADMRARLVRVAGLIESVGLPNVKEPHVRHVRGQLWEIRLKGRAGIARALYVTAKEQRVVILRVFIKKTEKTPAGEIDLALQRAKELKP